MKLSDFEVLSFDCYGTLIDWESGIHDALTPLIARAARLSPQTAAPFPFRDSRDAVLQAFAGLESSQQRKTPELTYPDLLAEVHGQLAQAWGVPRDPSEDAAFGASIPDWAPFPDTVEALRYLKRHFRLIILSNVDRASFQATNRRLAVEFDAVYTAQDIGSYKPDRRNFEYLLARLAGQGVASEKLLHVAQSLFHDHVPANALGLASAWIDRRHNQPGNGATAPPAADVHYDFHFTSLHALVEAHRAEQ